MSAPTSLSDGINPVGMLDEQAQRRLLLELNAIFTYASLGIIYTLNRVIQRCNPRGGEILGYAPEELIGQPGISIYPDPHVYEALGQSAGPILAAGESYRTELQLRRKDGSLVWCQIFARAIDPQDTQRGTIWIFDDIEVTRRARRDLEAIMSNAPVGIVYTRNRVIQRYNQKFAELVQLGDVSWLNEPTLIFFESEAAFAALSASAYPLLSTGKPFHGDMNMRRHDGSLFPSEVIGYLIDPADPPQGTIWIVTDISERKRYQEQLKTAARDLKAIMTNAPVGILQTRDRRISEHNPKFAELFGFSDDAAIGQPARILYRSDEEYAELGRMAAPLLSNAQHFQRELFMRHQNGHDLWINLIGYVKNPEDTTQGTIWILEDRSAVKQAEDKLRDSHRKLEERVAERTRELANANARLQDFADAASDWLWEMNPDLRFSYFSDRIHRALGVDTGVFLGKSRRELMHPEDIDEQWAKHLAALDSHLPFRDFRYRILTPFGAPKEISVSGKPIFDPEGHFCGYRGIGRDISDLVVAENTLRDNEEQMRSILDNAPAVVYLKNTDGRYLRINRRFEKMFGLSRDDILGKTDFDLFPPEFAERFAHNDRQVLKSGEAIEVEEVVPEAGVLHTYLSVKFPLRRESGDIFAVGGISTDITERIEAEQNLRVAATTFESQEGMLITDAQEIILRVNKAFTEITGYSADEAVGQTPRLLKSGRHERGFYQAMWASILGNDNWSGEIWNRRKNGELYPQFQSITAVRRADGEITHFVGTFIDITQRKQAEDEIRDLAFYDPLTRLPNRRLLLDRLNHALAGLERSQRVCALMFIDLDNFKSLNDTRGHDIGDLLLVEVSGRLTASVRQHDTVARLGGDEFVIMLEDLEADGMAAANAEAVATKVLNSVAQPYLLQDKTANSFEYRCSASIGITLFNSPEQTVDEILKQADLSMYQAKSAGRNTLRFFDPAMQAEAMAHALLEADLRTGVHSGQFQLHYQPQIDASGRIIGVEGLLRWKHPQRGMVSPAEFIPLAEDTGLILPLGFQVLETACRQLVVWSRQDDRKHLNIAVNVSALQLHHVDFVDHLVALIEHAGADPRRLKLEITESLLMQDPALAVEKMLSLREYGFSFSLDDFGTGYSSLAYLKKLPLDQIKIDRSFVRDLPEDQSDAVICRTIVALGHSLGFDLIAEGVETRPQLDFLQSIGCSKMQGYLISKPLSPEQLESFMASYAASPAEPTQ